MKMIMRGEHFENVENIKRETIKLLKESIQRTCNIALNNGRSGYSIRGRIL